MYLPQASHARTTRSALASLLAAIAMAAAAFTSGGCQRNTPLPESSPQPAESGPLRLLVIDDPPLAAAIRRRWAAEDRWPLLVDERESDPAAPTPAVPVDVDLVIFPLTLEADLIDKGQLVPVPEFDLQSSLVGRDGWLSVWRSRNATWNDQLWSLPLGSPALMLVTVVPEGSPSRSDVSWSDFMPAPPAAGLSGSGPPEPDARASGSVPAANGRVVYPDQGNWLAWSLLAHAVPMYRSINEPGHLFVFETMEPLVDSPPFVAALRQMLATAAPLGTTPRTPRAVLELVVRGEAEAGLTWLEPLSGDSAVAGAIRLFRIPGSARWFSHRDNAWRDRSGDDPAQYEILFSEGRAIGVTSASLNASRAFELAGWAVSNEHGRAVAPASAATGPFRTTHLASPSDWIGESWSPDVVGQWSRIHEAVQGSRLPFVFPGVRQPQRYLAALASAVREAMDGRATPEEALSRAANEWREITRTVGVDVQRRALRRRGY